MNCECFFHKEVFDEKNCSSIRPWHFVGGGGVLAAQTSATSGSTQELFSNDIDDFMDVNSWADVEPEKLFGFLGFGTYGNGNIQTGIAKQFSPFYLGLYFGGKIPSFKSTTTEVLDLDEKSKAKENTEYGSYDLSALFGFGNVGLKYTFGFAAYDQNDKTKVDGDKVSGSDYYDVRNTLEAGFNLGEETKFTPHVGVGFYASARRTFLNEDEKLYYYADANSLDPDDPFAGLEDRYVTRRTLSIFGGTGIELPEKEITQSFWDVDATIDMTFFSKKIMEIDGETLKGSGWTNGDIYLNPRYTLKVSPTENFDFKFRVGLPIDFAFSKSGWKSIDGNDMDYTKTTGIWISPYIASAMQYRVKENFALNFGMRLGTPRLSWQFEKDYSDGEAVTKTKTYNYSSANFHVNFSSGFSWTIGNAVNLDFLYSIVGDIFGNDFRSDLSRNDNFWQTVNKLVVANTFAFMVSFKF